MKNQNQEATKAQREYIFSDIVAFRKSKPTHTQDEWKANGRFIFAGIGKESKIIAEAVKTNDPLSPQTNVSKEEAEANAKYIIKCVNLHDKFIGIVKEIIEDIKIQNVNASDEFLTNKYPSFNSALELLKQAEQK